MKLTCAHPVSRFAVRALGFTLTDVLVLIALLSLLSGVSLVGYTKSKAKSRLSTCLSNLGQLDRAILSFAKDHKDTLPDATLSSSGPVWWWYKEDVKGYAGLTGESSPQDKIFACPEDRGYTDPIPFSKNRRFDYNSYPMNAVMLPGLPNITGLPLNQINHPQRTLLVMEWTAHGPLSWHRSKTGKRNAPFYCDAESVVAFVDGHAALTKIYYDGCNAAYTRDPIDGYDYQYSPK